MGEINEIDNPELLSKSEKPLDLTTLIPTSVLNPVRLMKLEPIFAKDRQQELDPIVIIKDPDTGELLVADGNNRVALSLKLNKQIPYHIYSVGDVHRDSVRELPISNDLLNRARTGRNLAREEGFTSFSEYSGKSHNPHYNPNRYEESPSQNENHSFLGTVRRVLSRRK